MTNDFESMLKSWDFKPGMVQARLTEASDGRDVLQMRVDLGLLQMETDGRPDGTRPHGFPTMLDYLRSLQRKQKEFRLTEEQCEEADRELVQYYQRRICWLALREFGRAVADADHTLAFMDLIRDAGPGEEYVRAHEQFRGFVLFHRTQADAAAAAESNNPERAIDVLRGGLERMKEFFAHYDLEEYSEQDPMVQQLRKLEKTLRDMHKIEVTLEEQLEQAIAAEKYEVAARIRDQIKARG